MSKHKPRHIFRERERRKAAPINYNGIVDDQVQDPIENKFKKWVVLVPYQRYIEPECERKLRDLEKMGITVCRIGSCSEIGWARCQMISVAKLDGMTDALFIDSDIVFNQYDVVRMFERPEPILSGTYPQKRYGKLNADIAPEVEKISFGTAAPPGGYQVRHIGAGFLRIKMWVLDRMIELLNMPCCTAHGGKAWPFFLQFCVEEDGKWSYLGEDYAFCERCQMIGVPIIADTSIRLFHLGLYPYGWEEACNLRIEHYSGLTIKHDSAQTAVQKELDAMAKPEVEVHAETNGTPVEQPELQTAGADQ